MEMTTIRQVTFFIKLDNSPNAEVLAVDSSNSKPRFCIPVSVGLWSFTTYGWPSSITLAFKGLTSDDNITVSANYTDSANIPVEPIEPPEPAPEPTTREEWIAYDMSVLPYIGGAGWPSSVSAAVGIQFVWNGENAVVIATRVDQVADSTTGATLKTSILARIG